MNVNAAKCGRASWAITDPFPSSTPASRASTASGGISPSRLPLAGRVAERRPLVVGGLTPFTTIDFPGRLAAVVFCQGCPWRCSYCHNPHLLSPRGTAPQPWQSVTAWLKTRRGLLDGVVFSGGEPLLQRGLGEAVAEVRDMGFAVALHTAGPYPERLQSLLPVLDWVGFDVKAPFGDYRRITGADDGAAARRSLAILLTSGVAHEVRCTLPAAQLGADDVACLARQLAALGVSRLVLQSCRAADRPGAAALDSALVKAAAAVLPQVELRH